jgi:hypothetical protein
MAPVTETRSELIALWRDQLLAALARGEHDILCSDLDFRDWPWNEAAVVDALTAWAGPGRRLVLLAEHYDEVQRRHPRFVQWRRSFGHVLEAWSPIELEPDDMPGLLLAGRSVVELLDRASWRARLSHDTPDVSRCRHQLDALLQRSQPAFAATTLGL